MPGRSNTHIASEPVVFLSRWRIFETDDGLKRLVGFDKLDRGCVSSAVVKFDPDGMQAQTGDGLIYRLLGEPGFFWSVIDTWDRWFTITHGIGGTTTDVTLEMCGNL